MDNRLGSTAGVTVALGDIKALLMHIIGKYAAEEVFLGANLGALVGGNAADHVGFNGHRNSIWRELRKHYPEKMDPSKLEGEMLKDDDCPAKFLHSFQRKWREETGGAWNANSTTESLFKVMVKKAMPSEVQKRLENAVGLMKMDWPLFAEHLIHHVESVRKEKQREEDAHKTMTNKLTQLQLTELSSKQKKDKGKTQAPVVTAEHAQVQPTVSTAPHPPITRQSQPPQYQALAPHLPDQTATSPTPLPPSIHLYVSQPELISYRPRGQPGLRRGLNSRPT